MPKSTVQILQRFDADVERFSNLETAQAATPMPLMYQVDLLRKVGFDAVDILHKNSCFAAFGGLKSGGHASQEW